MLGALTVAVFLQVVTLYTPGSPELGPARGIDKLAHVALFAVPAALAWLSGGRARRWCLLLLVGHAVLSELIQGRLVPYRSGDPWDALADVVGVLLGVAMARGLLRSRAGAGLTAGAPTPAANTADAADPAGRTDDGSGGVRR